MGILFFGNVENQVARPIERLKVTFNSGASADASEVCRVQETIKRGPGTCEITRKYPAFILGSLNTALPKRRLWLSEDNQILKLIRRARVVAPKSRLEGVAEQSVTGDHGEQKILLVSHIGLLHLLV